MISRILYQACDFQSDIYSSIGHDCTPIKANDGAIFFFAREKDKTWEILFFFPVNAFITYLQKKKKMLLMRLGW